MKTVIFSDCHLDLHFEEKKFLFLKKIIEDADQVIINGDFWAGNRTQFSAFLESEWRELFPLLRKKNTILIYGNHDKERYADNRINTFSVTQTDRFEETYDGQKFVFEHGDRILPFIDVSTSNYKIADETIMHCSRFLERFLVRSSKGLVHKIFLRKFNQVIKNRLIKKRVNGEWYVCGHTHAAEIDFKEHFANSGIIRYGLGQYLTLINGKLQFHEEWYE